MCVQSVRHHHERPDGTGYPDRLRGNDIPLLAGILSVVDVSDALTTERPYKPALSPDHATRELREEAAKGWKFELVEEFVTLVAQELFVGTAHTSRRGGSGDSPTIENVVGIDKPRD